MPLKVFTVVGTRPELIKLSSVSPALDHAFRHVLVHTGQNHDYDLNQVFFDGLGLRKPDHFLDAAGTGGVTGDGTTACGARSDEGRTRAAG